MSRDTSRRCQGVKNMLTIFRLQHRNPTEHVVDFEPGIMTRILLVNVLLALLLLASAAQAQFNFFDQMFGGGGEQERDDHDQRNVPSDSAWYQKNYENGNFQSCQRSILCCLLRSFPESAERTANHCLCSSALFEISLPRNTSLRPLPSPLSLSSSKRRRKVRARRWKRNLRVERRV